MSGKHTKITIAPNISNPQSDYSREQQLQMVNQLRLYFNENDGVHRQAKGHFDMLLTLQWLGDN